MPESRNRKEPVSIHRRRAFLAGAAALGACATLAVIVSAPAGFAVVSGGDDRGGEGGDTIFRGKRKAARKKPARKRPARRKTARTKRATKKKATKKAAKKKAVRRKSVRTKGDRGRDG